MNKVRFVYQFHLGFVWQTVDLYIYMDPILTSSVRNKRVKNFLIQQVYLRSYFLLHYLLSSCTLGKQKRLRKHTWKNKKLFDNWILYVCVPIWVQHDLYKRIHKIFEKIVVYLIFAPSVVVFLFFLFPFLCGHHRLLGSFVMDHSIGKCQLPWYLSKHILSLERRPLGQKTIEN